MDSGKTSFIALAAALLVAVSCSPVGEKETREPTPAPGLLDVKLGIVGEGKLSVTIRNGTSDHVVFCPREDFVICYYESPQGDTHPITWAGANAELGHIGPFMTVDLYPGSSYTLTKLLHDARQPSVDNRSYLRKKGTLYAIVKPVSFLDEKFESARKNTPFLGKTLYSNRVTNSP